MMKDVDDPKPSFVRVTNVSKGDIVVAGRVLWATTSQQRRRGLLGRDHLDPDEGMYIVPCEWIHTFGMRFTIDVAFLSSDGVVLKVNHRLRPNRFSKLALRAQGALEIAPGRLIDTGTGVGDRLKFSDV
jgi:uncharacterized membrane protein (UPF0127 family)